MKKTSIRPEWLWLGLALTVAVFVPTAIATDFQLIVPLPGTTVNDRNDVLRFRIAGTGGEATPLSSIPNGEVFDPVSVAFRSPTELLVGNRYGNASPGSVSRFRLESSGGYTYLGTFTSSNITSGVHEMSFNPATGEMFAGVYGGNVCRFNFDGDTPVPNGSFDAGGGLGIQVRGDRLFVTNQTAIRQYRINSNSTLTELSSLSPPGASQLLGFGMRSDDEMYVADYRNNISRYIFDANNDPVYTGFVSCPAPMDTAFSPDGQEMFVSTQSEHGILRFRYQSSDDSWIQTGFIDTPTYASPGHIGIAPIPEPFTLSLLGLGSLALLRRHKS